MATIKKVTKKNGEITLIEYFNEAGEQVDQDMELPRIIMEMMNDESLFDQVMDWIFTYAAKGTVTTEYIEEQPATQAPAIEITEQPVCEFCDDAGCPECRSSHNSEDDL